MRNGKKLVEKVGLSAEKNKKIIKILMDNKFISRPCPNLFSKTDRIEEYIQSFSKLNSQYENIISECSSVPLSKLEEFEILLEKKNCMYNSMKNMSDFINLETNSLSNYITKNIEQNKMKDYSVSARDNTWID